MNCNVTLTAEEFKTIHNTLWAMQYQGMDGKTGAEKIREWLNNGGAMHITEVEDDGDEE